MHAWLILLLRVFDIETLENHLPPEPEAGPIIVVGG